MLVRLSAWLYRHSTVPLLVVSILVFALFLLVVLPREAQRSQHFLGSGPTPDTSFSYTSRELYSMAADFGAEGRAYYIRSRFTFDLAWPAAYWLFLTVSMSAALRAVQSPAALRPVNLLPTASLAFDLLENTAASMAMARFPEEPGIFGPVASLSTSLKWVSIAACFAALSMLAVIYVLRRLRS